jgi:hypothetical protein
VERGQGVDDFPRFPYKILPHQRKDQPLALLLAGNCNMYSHRVTHTDASYLMGTSRCRSVNSINTKELFIVVQYAAVSDLPQTHSQRVVRRPPCTVLNSSSLPVISQKSSPFEGSERRTAPNTGRSFSSALGEEFMLSSRTHHNCTKKLLSSFRR